MCTLNVLRILCIQEVNGRRATRPKRFRLCFPPASKPVAPESCAAPSTLDKLPVLTRQKVQPSEQEKTPKPSTDWKQTT
jgi:hypothetical protein